MSVQWVGKAPVAWLSQAFPLFLAPVKAGFPSPADDYHELSLDLNEHLVRNPAATFFLRASGDSMKEAGIGDGDLLIVDRSLSPRHGQVVVAALNGELTLKRLRRNGDGSLCLVPANPHYPVIPIGEADDMVIWGVVVHVIRSV